MLANLQHGELDQSDMSLNDAGSSMLTACCGIGRPLGMSGNAQTFKLGCYMMTSESSLLIRDEVLHRTKEPDPMGVDALQDVGGLTRRQLKSNLVASGHIDHQSKWLAPNEEDVKLNFISRMSSERETPLIEVLLVVVSIAGTQRKMQLLHLQGR